MSKVFLGTPAFDSLGFDSIDLEDVEGLAERRGGYWEDAHTFVLQLKDKIEAELSFKQIQWAINIKDKLDELRRRGKL